MAAVAEQGTGRGEVARWRLWFGLLGGAGAWTEHLLLAYAVAEFGCRTPAGHDTHLGLTVVTWLLVGVSAASLLVALAATWVAHRSRGRLSRDGDPAAEDAPRAYLATAGLIQSGAFAFVILVESVPILYYLRDC
ncbi:MAG: hypothetical protein C0501_31000 [Isosphaera sp.]|nr:hypothetical protein [Isosphaera sp.]